MRETKLSKFTGHYVEALRTYFLKNRKVGYLPAQDLGSQAVELGLETLDLAIIHTKALALLMPSGIEEEERNDMTRRAAAFFTEVTEPIEKTHRFAKKADADLDQLNAKLTKRTSDLADSNLKLKKGVALRKASLATLKTSEDQSRKLLLEARALQRHLQDLAQQILVANEDERRKMSLKLQDEIAQTLVAIHLRLVELGKELSVRTEEFKMEIAKTQRLVEESVEIINDCAREFGIVYEN
jgi:signal transduction histidine kinase